MTHLLAVRISKIILVSIQILMNSIFGNSKLFNDLLFIVFYRILIKQVREHTNKNNRKKEGTEQRKKDRKGHNYYKNRKDIVPDYLK